MSDPNDLTATGEQAGLPMLSKRFRKALKFAAKAHATHRRKGTEARRPAGPSTAEGVPYLAHLMEVAAVVLDAGGDEDTAIAAVLHDVVEDQGGEVRAAQVGRKFGPRVLEVVLACSDSTDPELKRTDYWFDRKRHHVEQAAQSTDVSFLLVLAADKLSNCRALTMDLQIASTSGNALEVFRIFRPFADATRSGKGVSTPPRPSDPFFSLVAGPDPAAEQAALRYSATCTLWYYEAVLAVLQQQMDERDVESLTRVVLQLTMAVGLLEELLVQHEVDVDAVRAAAGMAPRRGG